VLGHDAEHHDPNLETPTPKTIGELDRIQFNNKVEPHYIITSINNEVTFLLSTKEQEGRPTVSHHWSCKCLLSAISAALVGGARPALLADAWRSACVGQNDLQE
jgi:hypothetical protein